MSRLVSVVALALVVVVAVVASTLLLASTGGDGRVGDLSPVAPGIASAPGHTTTATPPTTTRDDHGGHGSRREGPDD